MLELVAITYNDFAPAMRVSARLPPSGGTVGRDDDNTVSLPDPLRIVSRRHLAFLPSEDGGYWVENISDGNAVLVNDVSLSPGERFPVKAMDAIRIGGYLLEVVMEGKSKAEPTNVIEAAREPNLRPRIEGGDVDDFLVGLVDSAVVLAADADSGEVALLDVDAILDRPDDRSLSNDPIAEIDRHGVELNALCGRDDALVHGAVDAGVARELIRDPLTPRSAQLMTEDRVDPLALFENEAEDVLSSIGSIGVVSSSEGSESHHVNHRVELHTPFSLPIARQHGVSNELAGSRDVDEFGTADRGEVPAVATTQLLIPDDDFVMATSSSQEGTDTRTVTSNDLGAVNRPGFGGISPCGATGDVRTAAFPGGSAAKESPSAVHDALHAARGLENGDENLGEDGARGRSGSGVVGGIDGNDSDALYSALLEGLGLESIPRREGLDPEFMTLVGRLLGRMARGTVDLIAARAKVKREVRANVTVIAPVRNNPLKFSPDGEVALMYLLGERYPGFMDADEALDEAYADLHAHQLGIVSGMRTALGHVLERFDPETIAGDFQSNSIIEGILSVGRKARLWDAYGRYFESTRELAEDRFQEFFGAVFLDAYEAAAQSRLKSANGDQRESD